MIAKKSFFMGVCRVFLVTLCLLVLSTSAVRAQEFPTHPIRLVSPYPPGGSTDFLARVVATGMSETLGQPVVVDYKTGANGSIAAQEVARAAPDGYTILLVGSGAMTINESLYKNLPYDSSKDFAPLTVAVRMPLVVIANPASPFKTMEDIVAAAKENPGTLSCGTGGIGTEQHLALELFNKSVGADILHVPYRGGAPAIGDLMGGRIDLMFMQVPGALAQLQAGKVRAIAVTSSKRSATLPDVPTMAESGFPGRDAESWYGFVMPARVPAEIGQRLYQSIVSSLKASTDQLTQNGFEIDGGTPEAMAQIIHDESAMWATVIKEAKIKID